MSRSPAIPRICWRLVNIVSRTLDPGERAAVCGDFAESGETGPKALRGVLGLVIRRQVALWMEWRPWLALLGVVVPLGLILSVVSRFWADSNAIYAYLYVNNWTSGYLDLPYRLYVARHIAFFFLNCLTLICWSWTSGFALGSLSRQTIGVNGALFGLMLFGGTLGSTTSARNPFNDGVFLLTFYSVVFPLMLRTVLVVLPTLWGMHKGVRLAVLSVRQTILWAVAIAIMTALVTKGLQDSVIFGWWPLGLGLLDPGRDGFTGTADDLVSWQLRLLPLVMMWPIGYMIATGSWQRWRGSSASNEVPLLKRL